MDNVAVDPESRPLSLPGNRTGVVLCHGFTSTPQSVREWAHAVHDAGFTVRAPLLPGHGHTWQSLNRTRWPHWFAALHRAVVLTHQRCDTVVVGGISLGGGLALRLAQEYPHLVAGLVLVNPAIRLDDPRRHALPVLKHVIPSLPGVSGDIKRTSVGEVAYSRSPLKAVHSMTDLFNEVQRDLASVTCPIRLFRSTEDHVVPSRSSADILAGVSSADTTETLLTNSYHVATLDYDRATIFDGTVEFIQRIAKHHTPTPAKR